MHKSSYDHLELLRYSYESPHADLRRPPDGPVSSSAGRLAWESLLTAKTYKLKYTQNRIGSIGSIFNEFLLRFCAYSATSASVNITAQYRLVSLNNITKHSAEY